MPSGPVWLHAKWKDDGNALTFLESRGYSCKDGHVTLPKLHIPTDEEREALDYLFWEWDYTSGQEE
jgi:hypothetical protein